MRPVRSSTRKPANAADELDSAAIVRLHGRSNQAANNQIIFVDGYEKQGIGRSPISWQAHHPSVACSSSSHFSARCWRFETLRLTVGYESAVGIKDRYRAVFFQNRLDFTRVPHGDQLHGIWI